MVHIKLSHLIGGFLMLVFLLGGTFMVGTRWNSPESQTASVEEAVEEIAGEFATSSEEGREGVPGTEFFNVVKVIDGDTITISMNDENETIRLIGLDTPETSDPRTGVQCFGKEATEKLKSVIGKRVSIEKDAKEGERDKYDRLLAYVYSEEGTLLNKYMIAQGYAHEYTYDDPYKYQKEFKAAEAAAKAAKRGLWAPDACPPQKPKTSSANAKQTTSAAAAINPPPAQPSTSPQTVLPQSTSSQAETKQPQPQPTPTSEPKPEPKPEPTPEPPPVESGSYTCSTNKYNYTDFQTQAEAQAVFDQCGGAENDVHKLDSNKDGEACESLP